MPIRFNPIEAEFDFSKTPIWGSITGNIFDQTDLIVLLDSYAPNYWNVYGNIGVDPSAAMYHGTQDDFGVSYRTTAIERLYMYGESEMVSQIWNGVPHSHQFQFGFKAMTITLQEGANDYPLAINFGDTNKNEPVTDAGYFSMYNKSDDLVMRFSTGFKQIFKFLDKTADNIYIFPGVVSDTVVLENFAQSLSNKTIDLFGPALGGSGNNAYYTGAIGTACVWTNDSAGSFSPQTVLPVSMGGTGLTAFSGSPYQLLGHDSGVSLTYKAVYYIDASSKFGINIADRLSTLTVKPTADLSNIGGTTTANGTTTITGVGTSFLTRLGVGDRISLSSAPSTYMTVVAIASNTSLTVSSALGNGTTQTINRKSSIARFDDANGVQVFLQNDRGDIYVGSSGMGINPAIYLTGASGNTIVMAADSGGGFLGTYNNMPFRLGIRNGTIYPFVMAIAGNIGLGNNITNNVTLAGAGSIATFDGKFGIGVANVAAITSPLTLNGGTVSGSATTPAFLTTVTWNTTGVAWGWRLDVTRMAAGLLSKLLEIREDIGSGYVSRFAVITNTGGSETQVTINGGVVMAQGSGTTQFYCSSTGYAWYNQTGGTVYLRGNNSNGYFGFGPTFFTIDYGLMLVRSINDDKGASFKVNNTSNGSAALTQIFVINDASNYIGQAIYSSGYTGTLYGLNKANLCELTGKGSSVVYGSFNNVNTYIITNSIVRTMWDTSGNMGINTGLVALKANLEVVGASALPATSGSAAFGGMRFGNPGAGVGFDFGFYGAVPLCWIQARNSSDYTANFTLALNPNGGNVTIGMTVAGPKKLSVAGDILMANAGNGFYIKEGSNATMGIASLVAGEVTVLTTKATATARIFVSINGGTLTNVGVPYEDTASRVAGTSFKIKSTNPLDAADVIWFIIEQA